MDDEVARLVDEWIITFLEPPPLIDETLMRAVLAGKRRTGDGEMPEKTFRAGEAVRWDHSQGSSQGKVIRKLTHPTRIKDHKVAASPDHPEYLVESDKTGARAAHRPEELRKP